MVAKIGIFLKSHQFRQMNRIFLATLFLFLAFLSVAQEGDYFVSHFSPTFNQKEQTYFDLIFTDTDELVAANRAGIVTFDGEDWSLIKTPSAPLSISLDSTMHMYVACADDFGRIVVVDGQQRFQSLANDQNHGLTLKSLHHKGAIYFLQGFALHQYDPLTGDLKTFQVDSGEVELNQLLVFEDFLWLETSAGAYYLNDSLTAGPNILPDSSSILSYATHQKTSQLAFASSSGAVYMYYDQFQKVEALDGLAINDMAWISEDLLAVSTLSEGIFFYSLSTKTITGQTNSSNGLLDNEIFAVATDGSSGLWIANTFGFTRVAPLLPIRSFNHYPGLEGNLTTAAYIDGTWNIATSNGVYYFDQIDNYKNTVYYVPKKKVVVAKAPVKPQLKTTITATGNPKMRARVTNLLSKRSDEVKDTRQVTLQAKTSDNKPVLKQLRSSISKVFQPASTEGGLLSRIHLQRGQDKKIEYERRVKKTLVSTQYLYKKLPDVTEKIKQLIPFDGNIIAVTPSGIIEINKSSAEEIFSEPVRYVFHSKGSRTLWISTQIGSVIRLEKIDNVWVEVETLVTTGDIVLSIYEDSKGLLWMAGANELFSVLVTDTISLIADTYPLENQFFDNIRITEIKDALYLINTQGIFTVDMESNMLVQDVAIMEKVGSIVKHLTQSNGRPWIHNGDNWTRIEENGSITQFNYLKLFPQMTYIEQIGEELWLIDDHTSLFKFTPSENDSIPASQMYFRAISDRRGLLPTSVRNHSLSYEQNSVIVEMARPDYLDLVNVEYQYRMVGLNEKWSEWSTSSRLNFNYLPPGDYKLEVRSRDTFGREQESEPITFKIKPPYWQTTWFSALQVLFFTALVLIASRLNRQKSESKKRVIISNLLTIVTIVMVIELLQNVAESYFGELGSPVLAFGLDVMVALVIFPVETLLRRVVTGGKEAIAASDLNNASG
ncbi:MAG: ligand-binding sensor domain-containing protein [Cyclobacteriaceae bacterium]|jgi:ligand-binding sensor domain-containing protein